ncbi:relaxase/mobilization nuclease domain-containing protein [Niabella sp. CJ426]|uniref:relaxase/mobilization nuclease domain-containing protein n=1 Tax=Niabella sp. CJ426 TaxID=3393740 RepID=UPI003D02B5BF
MKKEKLKQAMLLHATGFGFLSEKTSTMTSKQAKLYLELHSSTNTRIRNKQFHAIMSCKGKSISLDQLKSYGLEMIQHLGYGENPVLIYGHTDTHNNHVHIITSRVDVNGRKISHHFERKRSAEILSWLLGTDRNENFKHDLAEVSMHRGTTMSQLQLLWELKGYQVKASEKGLTLFKYGTIAGYMTDDQVQSFLKAANISTGVKKIRALLYKYKNHYAVKPKPLPANYSTATFQYKTELTDFLHQRFGLQFLFFKHKDHEMPYGYTIIDHNQKISYQGSQVMKIAELLSDTVIQAQLFHSIESPMIPTKSCVTEPEPSVANTDAHTTQKNSRSSGITEEFDQLIAESLQEGEQELQKQKGKRKGSRRKFI